ncbi:hypothetical protein H5410_035720 [Solanum commersonii]|uniref:F-box domain-containing protein n=1 Tax=Solanum commersonii TaxID=4109 RepID=A0A9J5Y4I4_SOLCO|nr:hypothetical protein H5410_035720 [Solanum commersonii]
MAMSMANKVQNVAILETSPLNENSGDRQTDFPTSVIKVTGNTELLTEILLRLPPKSLLRFQTVCKDWLFHISSQRFRLLHSRTKQMSSLKVDGLFFCWWVYRKNYVDFIPINGMSEKQKSMIFKHTTSSKIEHLHSCEAPVMAWK